MADGFCVALGLMSGTSMDGIDAAVLRSDGNRILDFGPALTVPYDADFRERLRGVIGENPVGDVDAVAAELTLRHAAVVGELVEKCGDGYPRPELIGFHGHTVFHRPADAITRQIGDGGLLAAQTGIPVVADFRSMDVAAGGEGAPLAPLFHAALAADLEKPIAVLNVGGVANVTWIGEDGAVLAFDTGPGNAMIDDWVRATTGRPMDQSGHLARSGWVNTDVLQQLMDHDYFGRPPPKSLDRNDFSGQAVADLSPADGAATLSAFSATAVVKAAEAFPAPARRWLVCGGGRHNETLMAMFEEGLRAPVAPVEAVGWDGDFLEAQAFAFLAVRSARGLALSLPTTTGVRSPQTGGTLFQPTGSV